MQHFYPLTPAAIRQYQIEGLESIIQRRLSICALEGTTLALTQILTRVDKHTSDAIQYLISQHVYSDLIGQYISECDRVFKSNDALSLVNRICRIMRENIIHIGDSMDDDGKILARSNDIPLDPNRLLIRNEKMYVFSIMIHSIREFAVLETMRFSLNHFGKIVILTSESTDLIPKWAWVLKDMYYSALGGYDKDIRSQKEWFSELADQLPYEPGYFDEVKGKLKLWCKSEGIGFNGRKMTTPVQWVQWIQATPGVRELVGLLPDKRKIDTQVDF